MRNSLIPAAMVLVLWLPRLTTAAELPTPDQVVDRYIEAIGGPTALSQSGALTLTGHCESSAPDESRPVEILVKTPKVAFSLGGGNLRMGYDGESVWRATVSEGLQQRKGRQFVELVTVFDSGVRSLLRTLVAPPDWRWCFIALLSLPAFLTITVVMGHALGLRVINPVPGVPIGPLTALITVRFLHYLLFTAVFEEPGWRGFLLPRLQNRFSPLMATILVWLPCAVWHPPLDFSRPGRWSLAAILQLRGPALLVVSILITWLYNRSRGALLSPVLFHAGMGSFPFVLPAAPALYPLIFVWAIAVVVSDRMWRRT